MTGGQAKPDRPGERGGHDVPGRCAAKLHTLRRPKRPRRYFSTGRSHACQACQLPGTGWALVRPDGYLAATGESVDAGLVHAIENALAVPTFL